MNSYLKPRIESQIIIEIIDLNWAELNDLRIVMFLFSVSIILSNSHKTEREIWRNKRTALSIYNFGGNLIRFLSRCINLQCNCRTLVSLIRASSVILSQSSTVELYYYLPLECNHHSMLYVCKERWGGVCISCRYNQSTIVELWIRLGFDLHGT